MQSRNRGWMVLALFFCSGATALVYEVVWSKFLSQMFGSTIYAQTVVLAVFMGGLALGNRIFGGWADGSRQPVRAYGVLEIAIGVYALLFPALDRASDAVFVAVGTRIAERIGLLLALKGVLSVGLLLGPTILMGGTLPLLAAWLQRFYLDSGRRSARFYSVNSLGAVLGAGLAGFWLVQRFGMVATLQLTALVNLIVGGLAIFLSSARLVDQGAPAEPAPTGDAHEASPDRLRWAGMIVALTGAVSMGFELVSSRSLALIFGSSLQTFAVVLMAFILGIGLGSAWIASPARRMKSSENRVVVLLCLAAAWVVLLVFKIERWVDFYGIARSGLARTPEGYVYYLLLTTGMSLVILGVPAALVGAVLPLMIRAVSQEGAPLGSKVGSLLTWNTLGAVAGSLLTGFLVMPKAGLRNAFGVLALALALGALALAWRRSWRLGMAGALGTCALAGALFAFGEKDWQSVMSSGIFRNRDVEFHPEAIEQRKAHFQILFYEDAPDATVSVEQVDGIIAPASLALRVNGKTDAGTATDLSTQLLLAHLPMLAKPDAKDVFVLGLGSGMTAGALLAYPVERIDIGENCEPVIRAAKIFGDWNHHVLDNPRAHVWHEDARTLLKLRPQRYDVIITEPSNPWTIGIGSVFSREFYESAARRLKPGGIFTQWFHTYEMDDAILGLVLRTFSSVFPVVEIWDADGGDLVILGSSQPWRTGIEAFQRGFTISRVRTDLAMIDINSPEALFARQLASQRTGFAITGDGPLQSDLHPILEYAAPRAFYLGTACTLLNRFDERTRQQLLAPIAKRNAIATLPLLKAQTIFGDFLSVNPELLNCLFGTGQNPGVPCAFNTATPSPPPGAEGDAIAQASKAFAEDDLERAEKLAELASQQDPGDGVPAYLLRVIGREKQLRAASGSLSTAQRGSNPVRRAGL
jgi:predicted membrane-bound spermidine synthase